jgi:hypothetical protein
MLTDCRYAAAGLPLMTVKNSPLIRETFGAALPQQRGHYALVWTTGGKPAG